VSPLSPHHRRSLFTSLSPIVGEEEADALLDQLPRTEEEVPASQADLQALDLSLRSEMATGFAEVRTEMANGFAKAREDVAGVRADVSTGLADIRTEMRSGQARQAEALGQVRTEVHQSQARQSEALAELRGEMHTSVAVIAQKVADMQTAINDGMTKHIQWTVGAVLGAISIGMALAALIARAPV